MLSLRVGVAHFGRTALTSSTRASLGRSVFSRFVPGLLRPRPYPPPHRHMTRAARQLTSSAYLALWKKFLPWGSLFRINPFRPINHTNSARQVYLSFLVPTTLSLSEYVKPAFCRRKTGIRSSHVIGQRSHDPDVAFSWSKLWEFLSPDLVWLLLAVAVRSVLQFVLVPCAFNLSLTPSLPPSLPPFIFPPALFQLPSLSFSLCTNLSPSLTHSHSLFHSHTHTHSLTHSLTP